MHERPGHRALVVLDRDEDPPDFLYVSFPAGSPPVDPTVTERHDYEVHQADHRVILFVRLEALKDETRQLVLQELGHAAT